MAATSSLTEMSEPRRMAGRVVTEKKHSTGGESQEHPVGAKCMNHCFALYPWAKSKEKHASQH
jgi:hypothetical protein